ncbi:MAG: hypothetical protein ABSH20_17970, partial [Tepidisphaeraceae bacterium]
LTFRTPFSKLQVLKNQRFMRNVPSGVYLTDRAPATDIASVWMQICGIPPVCRVFSPFARFRAP